MDAHYSEVFMHKAKSTHECTHDSTHKYDVRFVMDSRATVDQTKSIKLNVTGCRVFVQRIMNKNRALFFSSPNQFTSNFLSCRRINKMHINQTKEDQFIAFISVTRV